MVLLPLTLAVGINTFTGRSANILQGSVHLLLFLAYLLFVL